MARSRESPIIVPYEHSPPVPYSDASRIRGNNRTCLGQTRPYIVCLDCTGKICDKRFRKYVAVSTLDLERLKYEMRYINIINNNKFN